MTDNDRVRKSISATLAEIEATEGVLALPRDMRMCDGFSSHEAGDALSIIARIEARLRSHEPRAQPDPKKFADFAES